MFSNFFPNNVPFELRSEVKVRVNQVYPHAGNSMCKSSVVGGKWHEEGPESHQQDWRETEVADSWDPESFRPC